MATSPLIDGDPRLFFAVKQDLRSEVARLFLAGADVNQTDKAGRTPLHVATVKGKHAMAALLLQHSAIKVDARTNSGHTALANACESGDVHVAELLLSHGANANERNFMGQRTLDIACYHGHSNIISLLTKNHQKPDLNLGRVYAPLHWCVMGGHLSAVKHLLLDAMHLNVNVNVMDVDGNSPLHLACIEGFQEIADELLRCREVDINCENKRNETPLHLTCKYSREHMLNTLLSRNPDANIFSVDGLTALHAAVHSKSKDCVEALILYSDADLNARAPNGRTPLFLACQLGYVDIILTLVNYGADVNIPDMTGNYPLLENTMKGSFTIVNCLLQSTKIQLDVKDYFGRTALTIASEMCYENIAKALIQCGADINLTDDNGRSPLYLASMHGLQYLVSDLLYTQGRKTDIVSGDGTTPLHVACSHGREEVVRLLLKHKANVNLITNCQMTALHLAIYNGQLEIAKTLSLFVTNLNQQDIKGHTALNLACNAGYTDVVKMLLHRGSDANIANIDMRTPLHLACDKAHENIVEMLLQAEARVSDADMEGLTALHCAVSNPGNVDYLVRLLMQKGADCNVPDRHGNSPFDTACATGHKTAVQLMRKYQKL